MNEYEKILRSYNLKAKRIEHSISTAVFMEKYAVSFKIDKKRSYVAGLLHDIAKELSNEKIIKLSDTFYKRKICKIKYYNFKRSFPILLHGISSAELLYSKHGIKDKKILNAVCRHTTGGMGISKLSKYTFLADYCEPKRDYPNSKKVHDILVKEKDFYKAYFYSYYFLIKRLVENNKKICPESIQGYNEAYEIYKNKRK